MIVFNSDFVLRQVLESIYPFADQIVITHGPVKFWTDKGFTTSTDNTGTILKTFPDPDKKITIVETAATEKTELCQAFMKYIKPDITHLWTIDADEIFTSTAIETTIKVLASQNPDYISFRSNTFFGGFDHVLTGFERDHNFKRVLRYKHGCTYVTHRPPTLSTEKEVAQPVHIDGKRMAQVYGVEMFHYSYVFPRQVREKIEYYESAVITKGNCIPNYFAEVWAKWVLFPDQRSGIEAMYNGVHEFIPKYRGECRTTPFTGQHPEVIQKVLPELQKRFIKELAS